MSIAIGSGTAIAVEAADYVLVRSNLVRPLCMLCTLWVSCTVTMEAADYVLVRSNLVSLPRGCGWATLYRTLRAPSCLSIASLRSLHPHRPTS